MSEKERKVKSRERPLSPHLQVYKPQITSMLSISHRGSGVVLYICAFLFAGYLYSYAFWPHDCDCVQNFISGTFGQIILALVSYALSFHFCTGIRHLIWDMGYGYDVETTYKSGYAVIIASILLAIIFWAFILF